MADDPDPHKLLYAHVDHLKPPQWVSDAYDFNADKTGHCFHCHEKFIPFIQFGRISKHHCRLCGELVCRSCTSKLHIPNKFEQKDKTVSRVCHECLFTVLAWRVTQFNEKSAPVLLRVKQYVWGQTIPSTQAEMERLLPRVFFTPNWVNVHDSAQCFKCAVITNSRHHCRLCGNLFCGDCSQKLADVPQFYDKKNKVGGKRVCDYCRFCMARGWRFQFPGEQPAVSAKANEYHIRSGVDKAPLGYEGGATTVAVGGASSRAGVASSPASSSSSTAASSSPASSSSSSRGAAPPPPKPAAAAASSSPPPAPISRSAVPPPAPAPTPALAASSPPPPSLAPRPSSRALPPRPGGGSSAAAAAPSPAAATPAVRPLSQCSILSCSSRSDGAGGFCSAHERANVAIPKATPSPAEVVVRLRWEEEQEPWIQLVSVGHADLHALSSLLFAAAPRLESHASSFQFVARGRPVQKMHWRMFEARFILPEIILKKTSPFDHAACAPGAAAVASPPPIAARPHAAAATPTPPSRPAGPPVVPPRSHGSVAAAATAASSPPLAPVSAAPSSPSPSFSSSMSLSREQLLAQAKPSRAGGSPARSRTGTPLGGSPARSRVASPTISPRVSPKQGSQQAMTRAGGGGGPPPPMPPPLSLSSAAPPPRSSPPPPHPPVPRAPAPGPSASPPPMPSSGPRPLGFGGAANSSAPPPRGLPSAPKRWPKVEC